MKTLYDKLHFTQVATIFFKERGAAIAEWDVTEGVAAVTLISKSTLGGFYWSSFSFPISVIEDKSGQDYLLHVFDRCAVSVHEPTTR